MTAHFVFCFRLYTHTILIFPELFFTERYIIFPGIPFWGRMLMFAMSAGAASFMTMRQLGGTRRVMLPEFPLIYTVAFPSYFSSSVTVISEKPVLFEILYPSSADAETYFEMGGMHFQLSYVSKEDLKNAKLDPQKYKSVRVRVSGFSDYFVFLNGDLQDEIITRTEQKR